jgi:hypothetical protein
MKGQQEFPESWTMPADAVWLNSEPVDVDGQSPVVTVVFFWDYTNAQCLDALSYVVAWCHAYESQSVRILSVHSPEFDFANSEPAVMGAVSALGIRCPVALDVDFRIWDHYGVREWPTFLVADSSLRIRYRDAGVWGVFNVEAVIQDLLRTHSPHVELPMPQEPHRSRDEPGLPLAKVTSDFRAGYEHDSLGNVEGYEPHRVVSYAPTRGPMEEGRYYLEGKWLNQRTCVAVAKSHEGSDTTITVPYTAAEVNAVIHPAGETGFVAEITENGEALSEAVAGEHVRFVGTGPNRRSQLLVSDSKLYRIIKREQVQSGVLRIQARSSGFSLYGMSFASAPALEDPEVGHVAKAMVAGMARAEASILAAPYRRPDAGADDAAEEAAPVEVAAAIVQEPSEPPAPPEAGPQQDISIAETSVEEAAAPAEAAVELAEAAQNEHTADDAPLSDPDAASPPEPSPPPVESAEHAEATADVAEVAHGEPSDAAPEPVATIEVSEATEPAEEAPAPLPAADAAPTEPAEVPTEQALEPQKPAGAKPKAAPGAAKPKKAASPPRPAKANKPAGSPAPKPAKPKKPSEPRANVADMAATAPESVAAQPSEAPSAKAGGGKKSSKSNRGIVVPDEAAAALLRTKSGKKPRANGKKGGA